MEQPWRLVAAVDAAARRGGSYARWPPPHGKRGTSAALAQQRQLAQGAGAAVVLEGSDHLLHGLVHADGFGHLLRMNGTGGGSTRLQGAQGVVRTRVVRTGVT